MARVSEDIDTARWFFLVVLGDWTTQIRIFS
jgi:hypothetical protein